MATCIQIKSRALGFSTILDYYPTSIIQPVIALPKPEPKYKYSEVRELLGVSYYIPKSTKLYKRKALPKSRQCGRVYH